MPEMFHPVDLMERHMMMSNFMSDHLSQTSFQSYTIWQLCEHNNLLAPGCDYRMLSVKHVWDNILLPNWVKSYPSIDY